MQEYTNEIWVEEHYSTELVALVDSLYDYSEKLAKDIDADDSAIRHLVATRAKRSRKNDPPLDLDRVRPPPRDPTPLLFDTYEELMAHTPKPPGPWVAVAVTPKSFMITWTDDKPQCSEHVHFTDSAGNRVKLNRNPGSMTESEAMDESVSMTEPFPTSKSDAMTHSEAIFLDSMSI
jgi:hypothetical protein